MITCRARTICTRNERDETPEIQCDCNQTSENTTPFPTGKGPRFFNRCSSVVELLFYSKNGPAPSTRKPPRFHLDVV